MNNFLIILTLLFMNSHLLAMKRKVSIAEQDSVSTIDPLFKTLLPELTTNIILELSKNVHFYVDKKNPCKASHIIVHVSRINKHFYDTVEKELSDPIFTRQIICNLKQRCHPLISASYILCNFKTLGAKKCIDLSHQLYNYHQDTNNIETLFKQGALLDYKNSQEALYLLQYTALGRCNHSADYLKKLLELGANPNVKAQGEPTALGIAINQQNLNKVALILKYNPSDKCWENAFDAANAQILYLIMDNSTPDDLTQGLIVCIKRGHHPMIMERFIEKGADIEGTMVHLLQEKWNRLMQYNAPDNNEPFKESIDYLLQREETDPEFVIQFKEMYAQYERVKTLRKRNEQYYIDNRNKIESSIKNYKKHKK